MLFSLSFDVSTPLLSGKRSYVEQGKLFYFKNWLLIFQEKLAFSFSKWLACSFVYAEFGTDNFPTNV